MKRVAVTVWHTFCKEYRRNAAPTLSERLNQEAADEVLQEDIAAMHNRILDIQAKCGNGLQISYDDILKDGYKPEARLADLVNNWWRPQKTGMFFLALPALSTMWINFLCKCDGGPGFTFFATGTSVMAALVLGSQYCERVANYKDYAKQKYALDVLAAKRKQ